MLRPVVCDAVGPRRFEGCKGGKPAAAEPDLSRADFMRAKVPPRVCGPPVKAPEASCCLIAASSLWSIPFCSYRPYTAISRSFLFLLTKAISFCCSLVSSRASIKAFSVSKATSFRRLSKLSQFLSCSTTSSYLSCSKLFLACSCFSSSRLDWISFRSWITFCERPVSILANYRSWFSIVSSWLSFKAKSSLS